MADGEPTASFSGKSPAGDCRCRPLRTKLSDEERWQLVDYIRTFANKSAGLQPVSNGPRSSRYPRAAYFTFASASETSFMSGTVGMS